MAGNNVWVVLAFTLPGKFTEALKRGVGGGDGGIFLGTKQEIFSWSRQ